MNLALRRADSGDFDWLFHLHRAAMRERVETVYGPWVDDAQRELFGSRDPRNVVYVLVRDGTDVGAVHVRDEEDGSLNIDLMEVHPDHQRQGVGGEALRQLTTGVDAEGRDVILRVLKGNPARGLYERHGFFVEGENETHLLMRRSWHARGMNG